MTSKTTPIIKLPMTSAERKAKQRLADKLEQKASVERIDQEIVKIFRSNCFSMTSRIIRREPSLSELASLVAREFPESERHKVYESLGIPTKTEVK